MAQFSVEIRRLPGSLLNGNQHHSVWLDRGELDKIIERAAPSAPAPNYARDDHGSRPNKKKRVSFLGDLFEF